MRRTCIESASKCINFTERLPLHRRTVRQKNLWRKIKGPGKLWNHSLSHSESLFVVRANICTVSCGTSPPADTKTTAYSAVTSLMETPLLTSDVRRRWHDHNVDIRCKSFRIFKIKNHDYHFMNEWGSWDAAGITSGPWVMIFLFFSFQNVSLIVLWVSSHIPEQQ